MWDNYLGATIRRTSCHGDRLELGPEPARRCHRRRPAHSVHLPTALIGLSAHCSIRQVARHAAEADTLLRHDVYYLHARLPSFVRGRVALLGDAAHAVTLDIGQGDGLAIEDALVLADAIEEHDIDDRLLAYDTTRRPRTERMARFSGRLATVLQTSNRAAITIRDTLALATPAPLITRAAGAAFAWTPPATAVDEP